ncbi:MAG: Na/Pi cotransporter family protein [Bacteroidales bacterium]|nr:Na/Pi cotransporter family protein [Bacteroidales bacterium]
MNYTFFDLLKLLGALGFFLFGMKIMSESLQKVAGNKMRTILEALTLNRFRGVLTGLLITAIIQSSSATTVMVVSFVNAGLLNLIQSIGVIMGANIGTTVTAWLISILGFKVDINLFALPLIGLALPLIFSKVNKRVFWGEFIMGFAMIFIGLEFLKNSVPDVHTNPGILTFFSRYASLGFGSVIIFLIIGTVVTMIIQSSSAVMALTLVMCFNGWINFEMAAAMVLGQNIGTTITANLAALVANKTAKQAARAHLIFNVFGVLIVLIVFNPFLKFIDWFLVKLGHASAYYITGQSAKETYEALPISLSVFHTVFNLLNTILLVGFVPQIAHMVKYLVRGTDEDDEEFKLQYINTGLLSVNELSVIQAKNEIVHYSERTVKMFYMVKELFDQTKTKKSDKLIRKIKKYEEISDRMEVEIAAYLTKVSTGVLSNSTSENINIMLRLINEIESINDACFNFSDLIFRQRDSNIVFTEDMNTNIHHIFELLNVLIENMAEGIKNENFELNIDIIQKNKKELNNLIEQIKKDHLKDIKKGKYKYNAGIIYCDMYSQADRLAHYVYNTIECLTEPSFV